MVFVALAQLQVVPRVGAFRAPRGVPRTAPRLGSHSPSSISGAVPRHLRGRRSSNSADAQESSRLGLERRSNPARPPLGPAPGQAWRVSNSAEAVPRTGLARPWGRTLPRPTQTVDPLDRRDYDSHDATPRNNPSKLGDLHRPCTCIGVGKSPRKCNMASGPIHPAAEKIPRISLPVRAPHRSLRAPAKWRYRLSDRREIRKWLLPRQLC